MGDEIKIPLIVGSLSTMALQLFSIVTMPPLQVQSWGSLAMNAAIGMIAAGIAFAVMKFVVKS